MAPKSSPDRRCPVLVLTGALGSGKTTLLRQWLQQPLLEHCAVIVNEIGQTPFDADRLDRPMATAGVITQQCVCCTGLPDLQETLERFFWDRLHRKMARFDRVVIETTGVADPQPVLEMLAGHPFLHERYRLEGVITTVSAVAPWPEFQTDTTTAPPGSWHPQIAHAHALVITKCDRSDRLREQALRAAVARVTPVAWVTTSALNQPAQLTDLLNALDRSAQAQAAARPHAPGFEAISAWQSRPMAPRHEGVSVHTWFEALDMPLPLEDMRQRAARWIAQAPDLHLLRFKGLWRCQEPLGPGTTWEVQWAAGDAVVQIDPVDLKTAPTTWGVTFIAGHRPAP